MTAICAIGEGPGGRAWLATDGRNTVGHRPIADLGKRPVTKTVTDGRVAAFGIAGYAVVARMLEAWVPRGDLAADPVTALGELADDLGRYLVDGPDTWRRVVDLDDPGSFDGNLVAAFDGVVATIDARFNAVVGADQVAAGGCSGDVALAGALALLEHSPTGHVDALTRGLEIAGRLDAHVGAPFVVAELEGGRLEVHGAVDLEPGPHR